MGHESEIERAKGRAQARLMPALVAYPRLVPIAIFALVFAITILSVVAIERGEREQAEATMREISHSVSSELEHRVGVQIAYLRAGAALFTIKDEVEADTFKTFVSELPLGDDSVGAQGIGWAEAIARDEVASFETRHSLPSGGNLKIRSAKGTQADRLVPVTFLEPATQGNLRSLGFDLYSEPNRRKAIDLAENAAEPIASGKLQKANRSSDQGTGFLVLMPVYNANSTDRALKGFIFSPFKAERSLKAAMTLSASQSINVRLYDGEAKPENLLATHNNFDISGDLVHEEVEIANHILTIEVESDHASSLSALALETLVLGTVVAALLAVVMRLLIQQAAEDQRSLAYFEEQNSIRDSLTRELNHRAKNTLSNVLSIIALTRGRSRTVDGFADSLSGRVRALSATHDLLTASEWNTTPIRSVVTAELGSLATERDGSCKLIGPDTALSPNDALSLGLVVHELATNAAKHGALSQPGGHVTISWQLEGSELAVIEWKEEGGPKVSQERSKGFGTELIERVSAHELQYAAEMDYTPEGLVCRFKIPVRPVHEFAIREQPSVRQL